MTKALDLVGQRFGRLVALQRSGTDVSRNTLWRCRCDCGGFRDVPVGGLRTGMRTHCGCGRPVKAPPHPRHPLRLLYGYTWTPEQGVVIEPEMAAHVRAIDALDRQGLTQLAVARAMDAAYSRGDGRRWDQTQIGRILTNRHLYRGGRQGKRPERWPVILEEG